MSSAPGGAFRVRLPAAPVPAQAAPEWIDARAHCHQPQGPTDQDRMLINASAQRALNWTGFPANMKSGLRNEYGLAFSTGPWAEGLREVQANLARLSPAIPAPMRWLAVLSAGSRAAPQVRRTLTGSLRTLDWYIHHYDAHNKSDPLFVEHFGSQPWYNEARRVHRSFRIRTGCKVEAWAHITHWLVTSRKRRLLSNQLYTHVWFFDVDMDFAYHRLDAYQALVAHTAPFLSQPSLAPKHKGGRASDYWSLKAQMSSQIKGRYRKCIVAQPIENNMALADSRLIPDFAHFLSLIGGDLAADKAMQIAMNKLAFLAEEFANERSAGPEASPGDSGKRTRPAGLVFDYVPVVHLAATSLPSKGKVPMKGQCIRGGGNFTAVEVSIEHHKFERVWRNLAPECPWAWAYT